MSQVTRAMCDNPRCDNTGIPESEDDPKTRGRKLGEKGYMAPYGWLMSNVYVVGSGPDMWIEVCSVACLEPAVEHAWRNDVEGQE